MTFHASSPFLLSQSCFFLLLDNKCSIHTVRPSQCSTYPWWVWGEVWREVWGEVWGGG